MENKPSEPKTLQQAILYFADPDNCLAVFKSDRDAGLILFAGLVLQAVVRF